MNNIEKYLELREKFSPELEQIQKEAELCSWNFYTNSTQENMENFSNVQEKYSEIFIKNEDIYRQLLELQKEGLNNKHLDKQLKKLIRDFQDEIDTGVELKELRELENEIASEFNSYIMTIDSNPISKAEIVEILEKEKNIELRKKAYSANVSSGDVIADKLITLVKKRNLWAKNKGWNNYFEYAIEELYDISLKELNNLLNDVYERIKEICCKIEEDRKEELAKNFGISQESLEDYHYGLVSENDPERNINSSLPDIVELGKKTYLNMGYDVDNMGITLDLYPRANKNTHGFAFCIEAGKDARILANLTNNVKSLNTLLHELGHCVYDIGLDTNLPFLERDCSSSVMTEAIAMMMGDLPKTENVIKSFVSNDIFEKFSQDLKKDDARFVLRSLQIIEFERNLYENPDDNHKLYWKNLKKKYLFRNDNTELNSEWATIPHYLSHPGYYQNYFRAALIKAQIYTSLTKKLGNISENKETAKFLNEKLFSKGASISDEELILDITGKPLTSDDFCQRITN